MRRLLLLSAGLALGRVGALASDRDTPSAPEATPPADFGAVLGPILARHKIPGMVAIALRGDRIIAQGAAGVRQAGNAGRVTLADKFHLGSDTKAMTATLAAMLVEEGKLSWTATLGDIFGESAKAIHPAWKAVTLQQVLAHRAGLPANLDPALRARLLLGNAPLLQQRREAAAEILSHAPASAPGRAFLYSNVGFILVGAVLEQTTGRAWEDMMRERLFAPLGISSGGFGPPGRRGQPWGHHPSGEPVDPESRGADNPPFLGPAGTAHMAVADWAKFIALHLRGDPANPHLHVALLKPESLAWLHTPAAGESYTSGWGVATRPWAKGQRAGDIGRVLTHAGSNTMWFCVAWLAPEIDFAVLIACNQGGNEATRGSDEVAGALIKKFAPTQVERQEDAATR